MTRQELIEVLVETVYRRSPQDIKDSPMYGVKLTRTYEKGLDPESFPTHNRVLKNIKVSRQARLSKRIANRNPSAHRGLFDFDQESKELKKSFGKERHGYNQRQKLRKMASMWMRDISGPAN